MITYNPEYTFETRFEKVVDYGTHIETYHFPQPVSYCNGVSYYHWPKDSEVRQNWGNLEYEYKRNMPPFAECRYFDPIWYDEEKKDRTMNTIMNTIPNHDDGTQKVPLKDFEIWLIQEKGFELDCYDYMCAQHPCFSIFPQAGKICYTRSVSKGEETFYFGFGYNGHLFYFHKKSTSSEIKWSVPYKKEEFEKAFNGLMNNI